MYLLTLFRIFHLIPNMGWILRVFIGCYDCSGEHIKPAPSNSFAKEIESSNYYVQLLLVCIFLRSFYEKSWKASTIVLVLFRILKSER